MKYRRLTNSELAGLEQEFIRFLILNGIDAKDWTRLKAQQSDNAVQMLDVFSDMVFETSLKKIRYLQWSGASELKLYHCDSSQLELIWLVAQPEANLDFTEQLSLATLLKKLQNTKPEYFDVYKATKKYPNERELFLFELIETGCLIHDGQLFEILSKVF